jgi:hypothetical protein
MAKYGESQTCKASRWASVCKNEPCLVDQGFQTLTEMWTSVPSHLARSALEVLLISAELSLQNYATPNPSELTRNPANVHQNWWFETNQDLDKVEDN